MDDCEKVKIRLTKTSIILLVLIALGLWYRLIELGKYSFWTDEGHVAIFSRVILDRGKPVLENGYSTGGYQWLQYQLGAVSTKIFGLNNFAIRFPSVIFGILTIWLVYLLGKELFNKKVGLIAAFLTTFLKIEILWSRQARPYQALQFFYLLSAYFIYKLSISPQKGSTSHPRSVFNLIGFLISVILATVFHGLGLVVFFNGLVFLSIANFARLKKYLLVSLPIFLSALFIFRRLILASFVRIGEVNNFFYYRVFLTQNYLPLIILAGLGGLLLLIKRGCRKLLLFSIFFASQGFIVSFLFAQPFVRYFYPVFPSIILLASQGLVEIAGLTMSLLEKLVSSLTKRLKNGFETLFLIVIIAFLTLSLRDKLAFFPQKIYSLNEDMQEIPEVDWDKIYGFVKNKKEENRRLTTVANWNDLAVWHLGEKQLDYLIRTDKREYDQLSGAKYLGSLSSLEKTIAENNKGIIILDSWDDRIPGGVRKYCHQNLKRELEVDRLYPQQPRYWTVWVYSWGLD